MMAQSVPSKLTSLVQAVRDDEVRFGYATKAHLLDVAEYIVENYGRYTREEYETAIILLARYRMANLADHAHGRRLIAAEKAKAYFARCCRCGAPISSKKSLETGLGVVCRKKLEVGVKAEEKGAV